MKAQAKQNKRPPSAKLHKAFVATFQGWNVYCVDSSEVRSVAKPDEEFGNFATQEEFADLIPPGEIWLGEKSFDKEGICFLANALVRLQHKARGANEKRAYQAGIEAEQKLRETLNGLKFRDGQPHRRIPEEIYHERYITLDDPQFSVEVWRVDGNLLRCYYKTDYTEGGHGYVYPWVPKQQIWLESGLDEWELPFIVSHEYLELRLMRDRGLEYDKAHEICSRVEFDLRKGRGAKALLSPGRRELQKRDLPGLASEEVFEYVVQHYLKK